MIQNGAEVTPEYIIGQITIDADNGVQWNPELYLKLINGCVKERVIGFGIWLNDGGYREYDESDRWIQPHESRNLYSTEQLYNKYIETLKP